MNKRIAIYAALPLTLVACAGDGSSPRTDASPDPVVTDPSDAGTDAQVEHDPLDAAAGLDGAALDGASAELDGASAELDGASPELDGASEEADGAALDGSTDGAAGGDSSLPGETDGATGQTDAGAQADAGGPGADGGVACDADNGGLTLPPGFCASVFAAGLGKPRHVTVSPAGDVYVAIASGASAGPSFVALRDDDADGKADTTLSVGSVGGNGIFWAEQKLYFASDSQIHRYDAPSGTLAPAGQPVVLVSGLPDTPDHPAKSVVYEDQHVYVNIGSASNSCQVENRKLESPGIDPCPELATRAGVWKFSALQPGQQQADGLRFASGVRNLNALAVNGENGRLFAAQNGRDQLFENWPKLFSAEQDQRLPGEGLFELHLGADLGWPYCYFDPQAGHNVLAPEYGGDGTTIGRCATPVAPIASLPAHWAPLGMVFYENEHFPARYRHGAFIANHGSRFAPDATGPLPGYNVVFVPFAAGKPTGAYERFAEGFAGDARPLPDAARHRPVGVAVAPDGALFVSDDKGGRLWRIVYRGQ